MIRDRDLQAVQEVRTLLERAKKAQLIFKTFNQKQVNQVFSAMAEAGFQASDRLARQAVEETGYGKVTDKILKNQFASRHVYEAYKDMPTSGVIHTDKNKRIIEIAEPVGVVAAIIPTTNPTSTALFKCLIAIKARNGIVVSPHPRAAHCTAEAVRIMQTAAVKAGAPEGLIGCMTVMHIDGTDALMRAPEVGVILATGGQGWCVQRIAPANRPMASGRVMCPSTLTAAPISKKPLPTLLPAKASTGARFAAVNRRWSSTSRFMNKLCPCCAPIESIL